MLNDGLPDIGKPSCWNGEPGDLTPGKLASDGDSPRVSAWCKSCGGQPVGDDWNGELLDGIEIDCPPLWLNLVGMPLKETGEIAGRPGL